MLKASRLTDFKSFIDAEVDLTLFVGANASGKSDLLDALWCLARSVALGLAADEVLDGEDPSHRNGDSWLGLRGGSTGRNRLQHPRHVAKFV